MSRQSRILHGALRSIVATTLALSLTACDETPTSASPPPPLSAAAGPTVSWNGTARDLIASRAVTGPTTQVRILAYLSIAQHNAIVAAEKATTNASPAAAAAAASLVVLESFFPQDSASLEEKLRLQKASAPWPEQPAKNIAAGEAIGRTVGAQTLAYAANDGTTLTSRPTNPGGPGNWTGVNAIRGFYQSRTFGLVSGDQYRPAAPPAFGSAEFTSALAEVRAMTGGLTPAQLTLVQDWAPKGGAFMNGVTSELLVSRQKSDREAARVLALANMAAFDVSNACFDAKLAYYYIRPSQADTAIKPAIAVPNHPSYPSGHSCIMSSYATVIASVFPEERTRLTAMVEEAGLSRMLGGLHFRFDCVAGQQLGRQVGEQVLRVFGSSRSAIPLN